MGDLIAIGIIQGIIYSYINISTRLHGTQLYVCIQNIISNCYAALEIPGHEGLYML